MNHKFAVETMLRAYIDCALWSTNDHSDESGGEPLENNYSADDIAPCTLERMRSDVELFYLEHSAQIEKWNGDAYNQLQQAGHDFWLTRNGHGAGFWESEWTSLDGNPGEILDRAAKAFGEADLYVGDNGLIYQSGAEESTTAPTLPTAAEVLREVLDHFRAADFLPDELLATALLVAYGGAS